MCEYRAPRPGHWGATSTTTIHLPSLRGISASDARLRAFALHLQVGLSTGPLNPRQPPTGTLRLSRCRAIAACLGSLRDGGSVTPDSLEPLLDRLAQHCTEAERRHWLECAHAALQAAEVRADDGGRLWRWLEILSLRLLHRRAAEMATVRYLHPIAPLGLTCARRRSTLGACSRQSEE